MTCILAILTDPAVARLCLDAAARAAAIVPGAKVVAFHPRLAPESMIMVSEEVMTGARRAELVRQLDDRSRVLQGAAAQWSAANAGQTIPVWHEAEGSTVEELVARQSRDADLLVLVRPADEAGKAALYAGIFASGRLLLLAPPEASAARGFGRRIAIAWHPTGSAARAIEAAMPWLRRAEQVLLLTVTDHRTPPSPEAALAILAPEGIAPAQMASPQGQQSVGAKLLDEAHRWGADCLVMGAYRHPRLLEMILGGVTQHMLDAADLPLFLLHE